MRCRRRRQRPLLQEDERKEVEENGGNEDGPEKTFWIGRTRFWVKAIDVVTSDETSINEEV